mmetsp:Transcript_20883/g.37706  ORF Transcript_20883/g.37706 Transcript_20883/m.37706 type:complete len:266 (+) Transcript_20883:47-844(+)|eukprot:CAMPEP_0201910734 /NCGR_PEP_ID=MMETSP0903-20130614/1995_1 /ASSEMBLY_ACC=CAM_ASM_000552 /TAXON_ID=420261 /ORGANISM="Thalassiosira antarctica, Strain CCMP982" /LENGTH=265 /DNA_ID=CAMNT_0048445405 /DNA_START=47 /DNA_END=844 /DNA_ORIENTATION=+
MTSQGTLTTILALLAFLVVAPPCTSFTSTPAAAATRARALPSSNILRKNFPSLNLLKQDDNQKDVDTTSASAGDKKEVQKTKNPLELASWYAVEAFGKAFGSNNKSADDVTVVSDAIDFTKPPLSLEETLKRIQLDNDRSYFLSGEVDRYIYDEECTFADPFVSFDGRDRFIDNLANLGSFITNYDAKMIKNDVGKDGEEVVTKVMVKLELNLPWKPVLAWPWGVTYVIDPETCLVISHVESWDIAPLEGVKQIFRKPTVKVSNK